MKALYTETFQEFLEHNENDVDLNALIFKLENNFPKITMQTDSETETAFSLFDIIRTKYNFREIGSETEGMFFNSLRRKVDEVIITYRTKVTVILSKFPQLLNRKVELNETENYFEYLNPSVANPANLNVNNSFKRERAHDRITGVITNDVVLLEQFQNLKSIYYEVVEQFEPCFMGIF